jgi:protocatechuate 3,4-dioxygenase beta subunit
MVAMAATACGNLAPAPGASQVGASAAAAPAAPAITAVPPASSAAGASKAAVPTATTAPSLTAVPTATVAALAPTDSIVDDDEVTPSLTEGPYFKPNSPERTSLIDSGTAGTKLTLTGRVLTTKAQPIAHALLDFWQADASGRYDNQGYTLRGHQFTNAEGQYQLLTVIPGLYPGRTRHIHVKVQAPNGPVLTTQLFFPNEPQNSTDGIFNSKLVLPLKDGPDGGKLATFNFVVNG